MAQLVQQGHLTHFSSRSRGSRALDHIPIINAHKAFWLASWIQDGWSTSRSEWQVFLVCPLILQVFLPLLRHPPGGQAMQKGCQTLSQSVLAGNVYSPLALLLCSCTALEQLQLQVSINFLLIQPISNKKITAALLGQTNCPSGLISYEERGLKKLIGRGAWYKVSGGGWTHSVKFHRFRAIYLRAKYVSAVYYVLQQVQDYSATKLSDQYQWMLLKMYF